MDPLEAEGQLGQQDRLVQLALRVIKAIKVIRDYPAPRVQMGQEVIEVLLDQLAFAVIPVQQVQQVQFQLN